MTDLIKTLSVWSPIFALPSFYVNFQEKIEKNLAPEDEADAWIPVDVSFIKEFWLPDAEILNLKEFETLNVLSKLEGLWLNRNFEIMYAVATRITFICPMTFNSFPLDVQVCLFQVIDSQFLIKVGQSLS